MNGPDHYREAENLLTCADHPNNHPDFSTLTVAMAQVHATLALAAATATQLTSQYIELDDDAYAWNEAAGTPPRTVIDLPLPGDTE